MGPMHARLTRGVLFCVQTASSFFTHLIRQRHYLLPSTLPTRRVQPCTNQLRPRRRPTVLFTSVVAGMISRNPITERPQPPPLPPAMAATLQLSQQEGWPTIISSNSSRRLIIPTRRMGRRQYQASLVAIRTAERPTHRGTPPLSRQEPAAAPAAAVPDQSPRPPRPTGTTAPRP